jgi:hypothetical protein
VIAVISIFQRNWFASFSPSHDRSLKIVQAKRKAQVAAKPIGKECIRSTLVNTDRNDDVKELRGKDL